MIQPLSPVAQAAPTARSDAAATAREFEAVFLSQVAKVMLETVDMAEGFGGGHGEEMFRGVMAERLGAEMARTGGVGLAPAILEQIIRLQEGR